MKKTESFLCSVAMVNLRMAGNFSGGKVEKGETHENAIVREIKEELDTEIKVKEYFDTVECDYPNFHLSMKCYICSVLS